MQALSSQHQMARKPIQSISRRNPVASLEKFIEDELSLMVNPLQFSQNINMPLDMQLDHLALRLKDAVLKGSNSHSLMDGLQQALNFKELAKARPKDKERRRPLTKFKTRGLFDLLDDPLDAIEAVHSTRKIGAEFKKAFVNKISSLPQRDLARLMAAAAEQYPDDVDACKVRLRRKRALGLKKDKRDQRRTEKHTYISLADLLASSDLPRPASFEDIGAVISDTASTTKDNNNNKKNNNNNNNNNNGDNGIKHHTLESKNGATNSTTLGCAPVTGVRKRIVVLMHRCLEVGLSVLDNLHLAPELLQKIPVLGPKIDELRILGKPLYEIVNFVRHAILMTKVTLRRDSQIDPAEEERFKESKRMIGDIGLRALNDIAMKMASRFSSRPLDTDDMHEFVSRASSCLLTFVLPKDMICKLF